MAYYVKCNEKTYKAIGSPTERLELADGNHLAWQGDFTGFPEWPDIKAIAARTGSLLLSPYEARQEQDGEICRELPVPTDEAFLVNSGEHSVEGDEPASDSSDVSVEETPTDDSNPEEGGEA
ncbi:MAG: hypothetical protein NC212_08470 [Staphylococcus sp.]|nr:hypothetical protein [Staphylococcus sp.]